LRGRLGPDEGGEKSVRILNRVVEWGEDGITYEADQRHAEIIKKDLGLYEETKSVVNAAERDERKNVEDAGEVASKGDSRKFRGLVARGLYLSQDRSDIGYAIQELSRRMSEPRVGDMSKLKRLGRYLIGRERVVNKFGYQNVVDKVEVWTESDYAGCRGTRRSTNQTHSGTQTCSPHARDLSSTSLASSACSCPQPSVLTSSLTAPE
jgi:hypothetical protein